MNAAIIGATFDWHDDLRRRRALQAVAAAFIVSVGWHVVDAVRTVVDDTYQPRSGAGQALSSIGSAWFAAHIAGRLHGKLWRAGRP